MERQSSFSRSGDNTIWSASKVGTDSFSVLIDAGRVFAAGADDEGSEERDVAITVESLAPLTCPGSRGRLQ